MAVADATGQMGRQELHWSRVCRLSCAGACAILEEGFDLCRFPPYYRRLAEALDGRAIWLPRRSPHLVTGVDSVDLAG